MHPVGPRSPGVYWVRRALLAAVAVAVVAGVVWFVVGRAKGPGVNPAADSVTTSGAMTGVLATDRTSSLPPVRSSAAGPAGQSDATAGTSAPADTSTATSAPASVTSTGTTSAATTTSTTTSTGRTATTATGTTGATSTRPAVTTATATKSSGAKTSGAASPTGKASSSTRHTTATSTAPPPPSYDQQGRLLCPDGAIAVRATTGAPSFAVGSQPLLGMTVTNTGARSCVRDLSGPLQVYTVYSKAGKRIWSTADCFPGQGSDIRQLAPGQTVAYTIKWSGTTSSPGCSGARVPVGPGSYSLVVHLGKLAGTPRSFTITG